MVLRDMITYKRLLDLISVIYCNVRTRTNWFLTSSDDIFQWKFLCWLYFQKY